jgi:hypothetical protein
MRWIRHVAHTRVVVLAVKPEGRRYLGIDGRLILKCV